MQPSLPEIQAVTTTVEDNLLVVKLIFVCPSFYSAKFWQNTIMVAAEGLSPKTLRVALPTFEALFTEMFDDGH